MSARFKLIASPSFRYCNSIQVKISDFGLSRPGTSYKMKTAQKMPIKWMAPESILTFTFTQKTDVYTFGVSFLRKFEYFCVLEGLYFLKALMKGKTEFGEFG
ncbi:hypothetical protein Y032_0520g2858 [Ancylostoma ceylanicum]|uniref:Protein kinase domain-containing protein n=1 Tax=Ancylostoma ceylanicum TaxID=53326 RepID=A0A016WU06_9BILA|nr:hypothetical protein Y032_0520g2858 [Ancylostoma ceylanicum]